MFLPCVDVFDSLGPVKDIGWFEDQLFDDLLKAEWWKDRAYMHPKSATWIRNCARCSEHDAIGFDHMVDQLRTKWDIENS